VTENSTHLPLGEICGSLTRFIAIMSAKVMGRLAGVWAANGGAASRVIINNERSLIAPVYARKQRQRQQQKL